jgi:predicted peroxiredoxin
MHLAGGTRACPTDVLLSTEAIVSLHEEKNMGRLLYVGTFGSDDPTRATMPFIAASGALDSGHEPGIVLMGEAVYLANDQIVDAIKGVGFPPLRQLVDKLLDRGVPFYF